MSQTDRLYNLLLDGRPHRTDEIVREVYGPGLSLSRVGARIWDIKKKYGVEICGWKDKKVPTLYWYQLKRVIIKRDVTPPQQVSGSQSESRSAGVGAGDSDCKGRRLSPTRLFFM